ncbi:winged helix DNA-binding domain-containing protein [Hamadaea tsunoensis]|uniref:winged helix DNA-binding domain-containing protein n=1 Tax=Hamadaea tsunoensis TaxID=53368 RepID=UPI000481FBC4|nr:winged helix DNA-binding domain-containing protein [Hamadaea tsunoensis]
MQVSRPAVSWDQALARRVERHFTPRDTPAAAAHAISGAQAQIPSAGEHSLALRVVGGTRTGVQDALWNERSVVRTHGPRGTVHLLPAADLPLWTGALSALPSTSPMPDGVRLTPEQTEAVVAAIGAALDGNDLTLDELHEQVVATAGPWAGDLVMPAFQTMWPRWRQALGTAARRGVLCFGPNRGRAVTYAHPHTTPLPGPEALRDLVFRYLWSYGPGTARTFAQWLGAPPAWSAELFAGLPLVEVDFEGAPAWVAPGDDTFAAEPPSGVRLLPYFDAYGIGAMPRTRVFPGAMAQRALANGQAGNFPVVLVDGVVAGVWHQKRGGRRIAVTVEFGADPDARVRAALDREVERLGVILEGVPALTLGPVAVGPHA